MNVGIFLINIFYKKDTKLDMAQKVYLACALSID